jgi:hypothetical protein
MGFNVVTNCFSGLGTNGKRMGSDVFLGFATKMCVINMLMASVFGVGLYLGRCETHLMTPILPVCAKEYINGTLVVSHPPSILHLMFYTLMQLVLHMQMNCAMSPYVAIILTVVHEGVDLVRKLNIRWEHFDTIAITEYMCMSIVHSKGLYKTHEKRLHVHIRNFT